MGEITSNLGRQSLYNVIRRNLFGKLFEEMRWDIILYDSQIY